MQHPRDRQHVPPPAVSGAQAVPASELLTTLTHELRNLLDGSLRCLGNAEKLLESDGESAHDQIATAREALVRMESVLSAAMHQKPGSIGCPEFSGDEAVPLGHAIDHAVDVLRPQASSGGVKLDVRMEPAAAQRPSQAVYPLLINSIRNAIESAAAGRALDQIPGSVMVELSMGPGDSVRLRVSDNGVGLPKDLGDDPFAFGVTTKPGGMGVGLAVCRAIIDELRGATMELRTGSAGGTRPGAVFEVTLPPLA